MFEAASRADEFESLSRAADKLIKFTKFMQPIIDSVPEKAPNLILTELLEKSGYIAALTAEGEEGKDRLENVKELTTSVLQYEEESDEPSLVEYLDGIALITDLDNFNADADAVVLMTIHTAKGLEFTNVFVVGMEESIFPAPSRYMREKAKSRGGTAACLCGNHKGEKKTLSHQFLSAVCSSA